MLAAAAMAGAIISLLLGAAGCGDSEGTGASPEEVQQERQEAAADARQEEKIKQLEQELQDERSGSGQPATTTVPAATTTTSSEPAGFAGAKSCGEEVYAAGSASCEFAVNVRDAYFQSGQGSGFTAYSPVTGKTYTVNCTGSSPATCTAGVNAVIYIP